MEKNPKNSSWIYLLQSWKLEIEYTLWVKIGLELSQRHFWKAEVMRKAPWKSQGGGVIGSILKKIPNIFHLQEKYFQFFNFSSSTFQLQAFVSPERLEILCPSKKQICLLDQLEIMRNSTFSRSEPWFMNGNNKRTVNVPKNRYFLLLGIRTFDLRGLQSL